MAFLDNSGDIILDAVLTDHGRKLLAEANGDFVITKFALADDEIDYSLYNKNHPSGSAYYDLEILQSPILEAFTDNAAMLKYNLVTYGNLELLFLPVLRLNETNGDWSRDPITNSFIVCSNEETTDNGPNSTSFTAVGVDETNTDRTGFLFGTNLTSGGRIQIDQGLDTTQLSPNNSIGDLLENNYTIQMDNRLGKLATITGIQQAPDFVDDDNIAYYTVGMRGQFVSRIANINNAVQGQVISGPRGSRVEFKIATTPDVQSSNYLFLQLGGTVSMANREASGTGTSSCYFIDTTVKITGQNTGCSIDVPIRYVRLA